MKAVLMISLFILAPLPLLWRARPGFGVASGFCQKVLASEEQNLFLEPEIFYLINTPVPINVVGKDSSGDEIYKISLKEEGVQKNYDCSLILFESFSSEKDSIEQARSWMKEEFGEKRSVDTRFIEAAILAANQKGIKNEP